MTTLFGVLLLVGGFAVLAVVRPWQSEGRRRERRRSAEPVPGPARPAPGQSGPVRPGASAPGSPAARRPRPAATPDKTTTRGYAAPSRPAPTAASAVPAPAASAPAAPAPIAPALAGPALAVPAPAGPAPAGPATATASRPAPVARISPSARPSAAQPARGRPQPGDLDQVVTQTAIPHSAGAQVAGPLPARTPSGGSDRISAVAGGSDLVGSTAHGPLFEEPVSDAPMAVESTPSESDDRFFVAPAAVLPLKPRPGARRVEQQVEQQPVRHHRVETIPRGSRLAREAGEAEIVLPDWLGPVSAPAADQAPARARHAG